MLATNTPQTTSSPKPNKKLSWKTMATVLGLVLFFTGAMVAVIIVQKQNTQEGPVTPVAPTAPVSEPSAAIDPDPAACALGFTVVETVVDEKSDLACTSKKAFTNFTTIKTDKGEPIPAGGMITAGKEFVYAISVTATAATQKNAVISDVLPTGVIWVGKEPGDKQIISYDNATRTVSANIGTFSADALTTTIEFKVKTATDIAVGKFTNTAKVQFDGDVAATAKACDATLEIPPQGTAGCEKRAITNFTSKGGVGVTNSIVQPGNVFVYQIKVLADKQTAGAVKLIDTLPAGIEFMEDSDNTAGLILSADKKSISLDMGTLGTSATNKTTMVEFKVKVASNATGTLVNSASVTTGSTTPYKCEQSLVIQTVGAAATPAPGCNDVCKTNADCSNSAHICYTTSNGTGRCRLDTNPSNESCSSPVAGTPAAPAVPGQPAQPTLPAELPQTGAEDWGTWLKAGLVTLGAGAILLLLL